MCIIIYKDKDILAPNVNIISNCFLNNPDGAGLALWRAGTDFIQIDKGFMDLGAYLDFVDSVKIQPEDIAVFHFRITTSGGTVPENCHPFPISNNVKDLKALSIKTQQAFIHNGVLGKGTKDLSDTQLFVKDNLYLLRDKLKNKRVQNKIAEDTKGSRTVTLDTRFNVTLLTGDWETDKDTGLLFSNTSYLDDYSYYYWGKYAKNLNYGICPCCGEYQDELGGYWGILECPNCATVSTWEGEILINGLHEKSLRPF